MKTIYALVWILLNGLLIFYCPALLAYSGTDRSFEIWNKSKESVHLVNIPDKCVLEFKTPELDVAPGQRHRVFITYEDANIFESDCRARAYYNVMKNGNSIGEVGICQEHSNTFSTCGTLTDIIATEIR